MPNDTVSVAGVFSLPILVLCFTQNPVARISVVLYLTALWLGNQLSKTENPIILWGFDLLCLLTLVALLIGTVICLSPLQKWLLSPILRRYDLSSVETGIEIVYIPPGPEEDIEIE